MFEKVLSMPPVLNILNMSLVLNVPEFWIYQGSEYVSGSKCARVLDISGF